MEPAWKGLRLCSEMLLLFHIVLLFLSAVRWAISIHYVFMPHSFLHRPKNSVVGQLWAKTMSQSKPLRCFPRVILSQWQCYQHTVLSELCSLAHETSRTCVRSILRSTVRSTSDSQPWKAKRVSTPPYSPSWWTRAQDQLWLCGFVIMSILLHVIYGGFPITVIQQQDRGAAIETTEPWKSRKLSTWPLFDQIIVSHPRCRTRHSSIRQRTAKQMKWPIHHRA